MAGASRTVEAFLADEKNDRVVDCVHDLIRAMYPEFNNPDSLDHKKAVEMGTQLLLPLIVRDVRDALASGIADGIT